MDAVMASRGSLSACAVQMLRDLPVADVDVFALSVHRRGHQPEQCRVLAQARTDSGQTHGATMALSEDCLEVVVKTGNFITEVIRTVTQQKPELIVVQQEARRPGSLACLAADGVRVSSHSRASVLLIPSVCSVSSSTRVVVGTVSQNSHAIADTRGLQRVLDMNRADIVVAAVASPFYPPLSRVVPNMRGCQSRAIREIHDEQAVEATAHAEQIAAQLACGKAKPLYVGRTGRFVQEISQVVGSNDTSLLCLLIDSFARKWLNKSTLLEMLENIDVPVLLAPATER